MVGVSQNLILHGFSVGLVFAAGAAIYEYRHPGVLGRATISLCLLELAWSSEGLFGLAALALEGGHLLERLWDESEPGQVTLTSRGLGLPRRGFLVCVCLASFWFGLDGAETVVNDVILIGAQQENVSHTRLTFPHPLRSWLVWRGPAYGFQKQDLKSLEEVAKIEEDFVYLSGSLPDPRVAAFMAIATDRPMAGWRNQSGTPALSRACALYLFTGDREILEGVGVPWVVERGKAPISTEGRFLPHFLKVHLEGIKGEPRSMDALLTATIEENEQREVPAASLLSMNIQLQNPTDFALDLSVYRGVRFAPTFGVRPPLQPIDFPVAPLNLDVLPARQSVTLVGYLRTDIHPLDYDLRVELTRSDGTSQLVPLTEPFSVRSWRVELPLDYPFKDETL